MSLSRSFHRRQCMLRATRWRNDAPTDDTGRKLCPPKMTMFRAQLARGKQQATTDKVAVPEPKTNGFKGLFSRLRDKWGGK